MKFWSGIRSAPALWSRLRIQHKVWAVLLLLCLPLGGGLLAHLYIVNELLGIQQSRHDLVLAHEQVHLLHRLAVDIEDGFRGYVLTEQPAFLAPFVDAENKLDAAVARTADLFSKLPWSEDSLSMIEGRLKELLRTKRALIADIQRGDKAKALEYIRSGEGLRLSDELREALRAAEDRLERRRESLNERTEALSQRTFAGLWFALVGVVILGWISSRLFARSLTDPIERLRTAMARMGAEAYEPGMADLLRIDRVSQDEFGVLAETYLQMARRIVTHIREIEVLDAIGRDINSIGPDGLEGVLRRITDRAVELVQADACLVLLRNDRMGCWIVEAASGEWNDRLKKSVMLWEEFPVSVQAYETRQPAAGERFRNDDRPQVARRNLIGDSMFAVPLLAQGEPFGVLALLTEGHRKRAEWNERLAVGMAQTAAVAISNARLYEAAQAKQKGLATRLRQLEHLAEALAHDLKGPGERMGGLAAALLQEYRGQLDGRAAKWLTLIEENSREMAERVEGILAVARVGVGREAVTAVDPAMVIGDVLKARASELEERRARVDVQPGMPMVAGHGAYLRQVFDNLLSNALKFTRAGEPPRIEIGAEADGPWVSLWVSDRGIGIPPGQRRRVFDPFVRLMQSSASGSGIGLTIVQRIVELYGGRVWIDEGREGGCTVRFTLPRIQRGGDVESSVSASRRSVNVDVGEAGYV